MRHLGSKRQGIDLFSCPHLRLVDVRGEEDIQGVLTDNPVSWRQRHGSREDMKIRMGQLIEIQTILQGMNGA